MGKVYAGQAFKFVADTKIDLAAGTNPRIYYRKPDLTEGYWTGIVTEETKLYCTIVEEDIGSWALWAQIEFDIGLAIGEPVRIILYEPGH